MTGKGGSAELDRAIAGGAGEDSSVETGIWRYDIAERMAVVIDGENYFAHVHSAMFNARTQIVLIGWDFDTRITLRRGEEWTNGDSDRPFKLGVFLRGGKALR